MAGFSGIRWQPSEIQKVRPPDPARLLRARMDIIVSFLPMKIWLNPTWAMVLMVPFVGFFPVFGHVAAWRLFTILGLHLFNSAVAALFFMHYRRDPSDPTEWLRLLMPFQALTGVTWGFMVWLLWVPGNALNHAVVVLPLVVVLWSNGAARTTYWIYQLSGVLPIYLLTLVRVLTSSDGVGTGLAVLFTVAFLYTVMLAIKAKKQTDYFVTTELANEDLTSELRAARDDALRKRYEAEAANASKTTFLANMSHELRTPLNAILGFSDIIASETFGPVGLERYRDYAHDINASGSHLLSIINDILDIAKIESGKMTIEPSMIDARATIESALRVLAPRMREKGQDLSVEIAPDAHNVFADERAFKQILINLVTNAVKFTQRGGSIVVRGERPRDGGFELIVEDNGPGIEPALLDRVFLPFNQVDNRYNRQEGGTGLGLSLVRGLSVLHGGKAWIETAPGEGVKVHVYFPEGIASERAPQAARLSA